MELQPHILFVDDDACLLRLLQRSMEAAGFTVSVCDRADGVVERVGAGDIDVVVSDLWMPGRDGLQLLGALQSTHPSVGRVLMSGALAADVLERARREVDLDAFFAKPWITAELVALLRRVATRFHAGAPADTFVRQSTAA